MKNIKYVLFIFLVGFLSCLDENSQPDFISEGNYEGDYFPTYEWKYCSPEQVGASSKLLTEAHTYISSENFGTDGYMIIKDGYIIAEDYFGGFSKGTKHASYSVAKSFTSAVIGIAIDKGFINSDANYISEYYSELQSETIQQWKKDLKISHILTMTSGINWTEEGVLTNDLVKMSTNDNFIEYVLSKSIVNEPGTIWSYNSGESMLLSGIINLTTGKSMYEFARENLLNPIGIHDLEWSSDSENNTIAGWGISSTLENYARFGYLYLNNGNWDGNQIISEEWVTKSTSPFSEEYSFYGYLWWTGERTLYISDMDIPEDAFMAIGAFGQYLVIVPSENLIIVRVGQDLHTENSWKPEEFIRLVLNAI